MILDTTKSASNKWGRIRQVSPPNHSSISLEVLSLRATANKASAEVKRFITRICVRYMQNNM